MAGTSDHAGPRSRSRRRRVGLVAALAAGILAFPVWVLASHQFSDVPNTHEFHGDVSALANAGITAGCGGGKFCPDRDITRGEMAAFMNRLGALSAGKTPVVNAATLNGINPSAFVRNDQVQHASCAGTDMQPITSSLLYGGNPTDGRHLTAGDGEISCPLHLANNATITGFSARVYDDSGLYETSCRIVRVGAGGSLSVTTTPGTGVAATPGATTLVGGAITNGVVANGTYAYAAACTLHPTSNLRTVMVTVTYVGAP